MKKALSIAAICFGLMLGLCAARVSAQRFPEGYINDNSDWWSLERDLSFGEHHNAGNKEIAVSNFQILGVSLLDQNVLQEAAAKLGRAKTTTRGDAGTAREQACYFSADKLPRTYLIFEKGEVDFSFYLFAGDDSWTGINQCVEAKLASHSVTTAAGLRLGMTRSQIESMLGAPTLATKNRLIYWDQTEHKTSDSNLKKFRTQDPQMSDREFHENYDYYTRSAHIEIGFSGSSAQYIGVSVSEVY